MLQDVICETDDPGCVGRVVGEIPRTKNRLLTAPVEEKLPSCWVWQRKSPHYTIKQRSYPENELPITVSNEKNILWIFIRNDKSAHGHEIPGWTGFVSVTGRAPTRITKIDYYPVINNPITEYSTVQRYAEKATSEVWQAYTVTTFYLDMEQPR